jgi:diaminopimelate epimerase
MKPGTVFYKMTGSGNDFVMFDGRHVKERELTPDAVVAICDRRQGIGADGVALLLPSSQDGVHFAFRFWNSDGSEGPMCGNGALCATRLAGLLEFARAGEEVRFSTPAGIHRGRVVENES